jgi:hypothetical protein
MFYVKEKFITENTIGIWLDGILDVDSIPILKDVCTHHLDNHKSVMMFLGGLLHVTREGKEFLQDIQNKVSVVDPPPYMRLSANDKKEMAVCE